jgi:hypothetical protein
MCQVPVMILYRHVLSLVEYLRFGCSLRVWMGLVLKFFAQIYLMFNTIVKWKYLKRLCNTAFTYYIFLLVKGESLDVYDTLSKPLLHSVVVQGMLCSKWSLFSYYLFCLHHFTFNSREKFSKGFCHLNLSTPHFDSTFWCAFNSKFSRVFSFISITRLNQ